MHKIPEQWESIEIYYLSLKSELYLYWIYFAWELESPDNDAIASYDSHSLIYNI